MEKSLQLAVLLTFLCANLFGQSIHSLLVSTQSPTWGEPNSTAEFEKPVAFNLQFAPNPFSREIEVKLSIPKSGKVSLKVFDILGQEVASILDEFLECGSHNFKYLGTELPAGRYYFRLTVGREVIIRQVLKKN